MRLLLAIFVPFLQFFTIGRPFAGIICLLLQLTLIGWVPAAMWSVYALSQYKTDQKIREALRQSRQSTAQPACGTYGRPDRGGMAVGHGLAGFGPDLNMGRSRSR